MTIKTVAVLMPGDMGHAIGATLRHGGLRVITSLPGRSARTIALAAKAGIEDVGDDQALVREANVILSVLAPGGARSVGDRIAKALAAVGTTRNGLANGPALLYADLNAIAPQTTRDIGQTVSAAGARFVDGGIIGGPPKPGGTRPRIYASGEHANALLELNEHGLDVRLLGPEIGQASGLKMCYGALTKGLTALSTELLTAAEAMGLSAPLEAELRQGPSTLFTWIERSVPGMPPKAYRWVAEMEEIAATFGALGLPPTIMEGAAALYRFVEQSPLGAETPENRHQGTTAADVVRVLAGGLPGRSQGDLPVLVAPPASAGSRA
jgi:L-threonate 2-dehydrogenase